MFYLLSIACLTLLSTSGTRADSANGTSVTRVILQLMHDLSSCPNELEGLVNEASVLSVSVNDIIRKLEYLENVTENEIEIYRNTRQNISLSFPSGQIDSRAQLDYEYSKIVISHVDVPNDVTLNDGICFENTWARSYLNGNESRCNGLTWKNGQWQKLRKSRPGQLGIWLGSFDACAAVDRRWDQICYISGLAVLRDETIVVSDSENFLIRVFDIKGDPLREFYFEPLILGELTSLPGPKKRILADVTLLNGQDSTLFVDLEDGSSKFINKSELDSESTETTLNCTITDLRAWQGIRSKNLSYQRGDGTTFVAGYNERGYERNVILQYDSNCTFIGITTRTRYDIEAIKGLADVLVVNLDTGRHKFSRDRVAVFHVP